jgi:VIT1/CCC1 family predicted Fe2+/Mn2+ transporter
MRHSFKTGFSFGLTSGIITTLGLMVGLHSATLSKFAVIGGILTIAISDAFSDALGIHICEESENKHSSKEVWESTLSTFLSKFVFSSTFILPLMLFSLNLAIVIAVIWGLTLLGVLSFFITPKRHNPQKVVLEHLSIALVVIIIAHYLGDWIASVFH